MRPDRRSTAAGAVLVALTGFVLFDPLGVRAIVGSWVGIAEPVSGPPRALAPAIEDRTATLESLESALAADPTLSLAILATGVGLGLLVGSTAAYVHQRRLIRRGEHDE